MLSSISQEMPPIELNSGSFDHPKSPESHSKTTGWVICRSDYFGAPSRLTMDTVHAGPLAAYTLDVATRFASEPGARADADEDCRRFSTPRC